MSILNNHIPFVKEQISFQERQAQKFAADKFRQNLHLSKANEFKVLLEDIQKSDKKLDEPPVEAHRKITLKQKLSLAPEDILGLPEDLLKELSVSDADKTEFIILSLIDESGGVISLDKLLIGLFKKTGDIIKRSGMTSRLYRMSSKGMLFNVPGKKGYYSKDELTESEVEKIFGSDVDSIEGTIIKP